MKIFQHYEALDQLDQNLDISLYMRLESSDTISLRTGVVGYGLRYITLCIELAQFDWVPPM